MPLILLPHACKGGFLLLAHHQQDLSTAHLAAADEACVVSGGERRVRPYLEDLLLCCVEGEIANIQRGGFPQTIFKFLLCSVESTVSILADRWVQLLRSKQHSMSDLPRCYRLLTCTSGSMGKQVPSKDGPSNHVEVVAWRASYNMQVIPDNPHGLPLALQSRYADVDKPAPLERPSKLQQECKSIVVHTAWSL